MSADEGEWGEDEEPDMSADEGEWGEDEEPTMSADEGEWGEDAEPTMSADDGEWEATPAFSGRRLVALATHVGALNAQAVRDLPVPFRGALARVVWEQEDRVARLKHAGGSVSPGAELAVARQIAVTQQAFVQALAGVVATMGPTSRTPGGLPLSADPEFGRLLSEQGALVAGINEDERSLSEERLAEFVSAQTALADRAYRFAGSLARAHADSGAAAHGGEQGSRRPPSADPGEWEDPPIQSADQGEWPTATGGNEDVGVDEGDLDHEDGTETTLARLAALRSLLQEHATPGPQDSPTESESTRSFSVVAGQEVDPGGELANRASGYVTVGSFSIEEFGRTKRAKLPVMHVLAGIADRFDILAVQGIRDRSMETPGEFLEWLNDEGPEEHDVAVSDRLGRSSRREQYAVYYDTRFVTLLRSPATYPDSGGVFEREPFAVRFRVGMVDFVLLTVHVDSNNAAEEIAALGNAVDWAVEAFDDEDIMVVGALNADCVHFPESERESALPMAWITPTTLDTTVSGAGCTYDHILLSESLATRTRGTAEALRFDVDFRLGNLDPLQISGRYPVWVELTTTP